jgi:hypothetical protein
LNLEIPADLTITVHLLKGIIMKSLANVFNSGVIRQFITADYEDFSVEIVKILLGTVVTGVTGFAEQLTVELDGGGESLLLELSLIHELIIARFGCFVKGVNRPEKGGKPP